MTLLKIWLGCVWRSFTVFRLLGVPVRFHTTTLLWPCGILGWMEWRNSGLPGLFETGVFIALLYGSLLVHEFAHVLVARYFGCGTDNVYILPFGCLAALEDIPREPSEVLIAMAGPLASLALFAVATLSMSLMPPTSTRLWFDEEGFTCRGLLVLVSHINLGVGLFNLLPCFPMDGGRVFRSVLALAIGLVRPRRASDAFLLATRVAVRYVSRVIALGAIGLTVVHTHFWMHIVLFGFLIVAGEVEYLVLRESPRCLAAPIQLTLWPVSRSQLNPRKLPYCDPGRWTIRT